MDAFTSDLYGCTGTLRAKRARRDPFAFGVPLVTQCPALEGISKHCGSAIYGGRLPWDA